MLPLSDRLVFYRRSGLSQLQQVKPVFDYLPSLQLPTTTVKSGVECREGRSLVLTLGFNRIILIDLQEAYCILECSSGINSSACNDRQNGAARESSTLVYPLVRINVLPRLFCR